MKKFNAVTARRVVGLDLGDRHSQLVVLEGKSGEVIESGRVRTTPAALGDCFVVARFWWSLGSRIEVIRNGEGVPERLGDARPRAQLMALPGSGLRRTEPPPLDCADLVGLV